MANKINTVLYTGFSSILPGRVLVHKDKVVEGFTKKYNVNQLVYYETCDSREGALWRERQIKAGSRQDKMELINSVNPKWEDLSDKL
jgi:putative endonuclease